MTELKLSNYHVYTHIIDSYQKCSISTSLVVKGNTDYVGGN